MSSQQAHRSSREHSGRQADDRRFEQMRMEDVDPFAAEKPRETNHPKRVLGSMPAIATEALHALGFHILAQPGHNRIERGEEHPIAVSVMPPRKLRKETAGVAVLGKMQDSLH
jgi:hypothetical protein